MLHTLGVELMHLASGVMYCSAKGWLFKQLRMASTTHRKHGLSGTINSFPDELLCQVLKRLDLATKLQAHTVCHHWNNILSSPCCADLWTEVPRKTMAGIKLKRQCKKDIEQYTQWLADRATGILCAGIATEQWVVEPGSSVYTEARFFWEQQLPFLLGYLHYHNKQLDIALTAGEIRSNLCIVSLCQAGSLLMRDSECRCQAHGLSSDE